MHARTRAAMQKLKEEVERLTAQNDAQRAALDGAEAKVMKVVEDKRNELQGRAYFAEQRYTTQLVGVQAENTAKLERTKAEHSAIVQTLEQLLCQERGDKDQLLRENGDLAVQIEQMKQKMEVLVRSHNRAQAQLRGRVHGE